MIVVGLDHVVVLVADIAAAAQAYKALFARAPAWRASQDGAVTVLFTLDNVTLELMAAEGDGEAARRIRAAHALQADGLASLCFRVNDLPKMHRRLTRLALQPDDIMDGGSTDTITGASLNWRRTRAAASACNGVRIFFMQMIQERPRSEPSDDAPILGLDHVVLATHDPERAAALFGARLGLDMALDRSRPDWGRLMFFRCGDLVIEVAQRPGANARDTPDKLWGLSWRVADIEATRARLVVAGIDVSEVRTGRKPGTRVLSLKSGACAVPTLLLEKSEATAAIR